MSSLNVHLNENVYSYPYILHTPKFWINQEFLQDLYLEIQQMSTNIGTHQRSIIYIAYQWWIVETIEHYLDEHCRSHFYNHRIAHRHMPYIVLIEASQVIKVGMWSSNITIKKNHCRVLKFWHPGFSLISQYSNKTTNIQ